MLNVYHTQSPGPMGHKRLGMRDLIEGTKHLVELVDHVPDTDDFLYGSGSLLLDNDLGGGLTPGIVQLYGPDQVGKTALLGGLMGLGQDRPVMYVSADYYDPEYLKNLGVDIDAMAMVMGGDPEMWDKVRDFLAEGPSIVGVDTLDNLLLRPDLDTKTNSLWTYLQGWREAMHPQSLLVCCSQVRNRLSRPGQQASTFNLLDMMDVSLKLKRGQESGLRYLLWVDIEKNTLTPPKTAKTALPMIKGLGVDVAMDVLKWAGLRGIIRRSGVWWYFGDLNLGQGMDNVADRIRADAVLMTDIVKAAQ